MSLPGKLIVIEGLEGSGKSTTVNTIVQCLEKAGIQAQTVREPGGTAIGETLRSIIKNPDYKNILHPKSELLLMYAARIQLLQDVIFPALQKGIWIVADRFELSSFAYQGGGRGLDLNFIQALSKFSLEGFQADLTLYLDIEPEKGMERARLRSHFDRIEQEPIDFFHRIHAAYQQRIKHLDNVHVINASFELELVQKEIQAIIQDYIQLHKKEA